MELFPDDTAGHCLGVTWDAGLEDTWEDVANCLNVATGVTPGEGTLEAPVPCV